MKKIKVWIATSSDRVQTDIDGAPMVFKTRKQAAAGGFKAYPATLTFYIPRKDRWGREVDECGQIPCGAFACDTHINYDYPDGSKRTYCAEHEETKT